MDELDGLGDETSGKGKTVDSFSYSVMIGRNTEGIKGAYLC